MEPFFSNAGHCTRCGEPFGGNATAYMVRERVICEIYYDTVAVTQDGAFAVCDACVKPDEEAGATEPINCEGCGQRMRTSAKVMLYRDYLGWCDPLRVCSDRCRQRVRRRRRKKLRPAIRCETCDTRFKPTRTDAKFCSAACRQSAYRDRLQAS
jgi:hypothetical protein